MGMNNFTTAILSALSDNNIKQVDLAQKLDTARSTITFLLQGRRPNDELLVALCSPKTWPEGSTGLTILSAWLEDEIVRAGRTLEEIAPAIHGDSKASRDMERDFRLIRQWLPGNPDVRAILRHLAESAEAERDFKGNALTVLTSEAEPFKAERKSNGPPPKKTNGKTA